MEEHQEVEDVVNKLIEGVVVQLEPDDSKEEEPNDSENVSTSTITDVQGTVHALPSTSRSGKNKKLFVEAKLRNKMGVKPCRRCSFRCAMRSKKLSAKTRVSACF